MPEQTVSTMSIVLSGPSPCLSSSSVCRLTGRNVAAGVNGLAEAVEV